MSVTPSRNEEKDVDEPYSVYHSDDPAEDSNFLNEHDLILKKDQTQTAG